MAIVMLSAFLLAGIFIAIEAEHDCEGEDCYICECLEQCHALLNRAVSAPASCKAAVFSVALLITSCFHILRVFRRETPVSIKVRLND
ncbi:MAG: hypothetical protein K5665_07960 [Saccharofermentans sp.]|nr:hypothetical protein [Saccharofermentans sp.]